MSEQAQTVSNYNENAIAIAKAIASNYKAGPSSKRPREELFPDFNRSGLGVALEYEQMGNQPVSDQLAEQVDELGLTLEHLGLTLGTVIHGIDLKQPLTTHEIKVLRSCLLERKVIFFREQHLNEDEHVRFARYFGELDAFPFGKPGNNPYVLHIHHNDQNPGRENGWHTDVTWMEEPSLGSIAQCDIVPPAGGDTLFADSYAAYQGLAPALQRQLQDMDAIHDYRIFLAGRGRDALPESLAADIQTRIPFGVCHPVLRTHPETGKTALYIHGGFIRHDSLHHRGSDNSLDGDESRSIVKELLAQHARPEYQCRFQWTPGSIAFWDNRAVQHYAASDYHPHERLLRRVTISGDRPYYRPAVELA